jgi:hypothetical protein
MVALLLLKIKILVAQAAISVACAELALVILIIVVIDLNGVMVDESLLKDPMLFVVLMMILKPLSNGLVAAITPGITAIQTALLAVK